MFVIPVTNSYPAAPNNYQNNLNFSGKINRKKADDICRNVMNEFPVYLGSKLKGYSNISKEESLLDFSESMIACIRQFYICADTANGQLFRELKAIKAHKVANCAELADASYVALKLNGYRDVERINLYAYNKKEKTVRDLDHTVACIDLGLPKDYKYCPLALLNSKAGPSPEYRVYPKRDTIIVDAWNGTADYANNMKQIYNNHPTLIKNKNKKYNLGDTLLKEGEELCFFPISDGIHLNSKDYSYLCDKYKGLVTPQNRKNIPQIDYSHSEEYVYPYISTNRVKCLRYESGMKNSPSEDDYDIAKKMCIYETFGIYPVDDKPVKKSLFSKTLALFKKIF